MLKFEDINIIQLIFTVVINNNRSMDDSPLIAGSRNEPTGKQGHKILGCLCDSKRSTIIWNTLNIILAIIIMVFWAVEAKGPASIEENSGKFGVGIFV